MQDVCYVYGQCICHAAAPAAAEVTRAFTSLKFDRSVSIAPHTSQPQTHLGVVACADQDLQRSAGLAAGPQPSELGAKEGKRLSDMLPMQVHKVLAASAACSLHQKDK